MKIGIFATFVLFITFILSCFASAEQNFTGSSMDVSVDIPATMEWAEVELNTSSIDFGPINLSATSSIEKRKSVYYEIRNRGNVNISVMPSLASGADPIFDNLRFSRLVSDSLSTWRSVGNYSISMNATPPSGIWASWQRYAIRLDLNAYQASLPFDVVGYKKTVVFEVIPRYG
jgi:hypothetical protein